MPYHLTAGVAANVPDELGRGVHRPFISGFTCTSLLPKVVQWSVEVLGAWSFVSSPHATRKCRLLPEAQERGLTFVIRMHRLSHPVQPIYLQDTWRAWARRRLCCGCGEAAPALQRLPSRRTWTWFGGSAAAACGHG